MGIVTPPCGGMENEVPKPGEWPVDPQEDQTILEDRIWIDGCFDFFHHGHAGVMLQARQLGRELYVGLHSDEDILEHKGPTVMNLQERVSACDACRWVTKSVPHAPYVTYLPWISHYGCKYVVHGDDITSDSGGEDCYRFVKRAGRFKVVKRTPGISTTDLVGRMLLCTKSHFIRSLKDALNGTESGNGSSDEQIKEGKIMAKRMREYATNETGLEPGVDVYTWTGSSVRPTAGDHDGELEVFVPGQGPLPAQRYVYVDGGFDLFSSGHIEFLRSVSNIERRRAEEAGWYTEAARSERISKYGKDYEPAYVIAGIHDDEVINREKGLNYPIMNIFERGLCLLQCRYVHSVVFGAPFEPAESFLRKLPRGIPDVVYHGPTSFMPLGYDPYKQAKALKIFEEVPPHAFQDVNAGQIVDRIMKSRAMFEDRQRKKGVKAVGEEAARRKEVEEEAAAAAAAAASSVGPSGS